MQTNIHRDCGGFVTNRRSMRASWIFCTLWSSHADRAIYSFKNRQAEEMVQIVRRQRRCLKNTVPNFFSCSFPHWPMGWRVAGYDALFKLGSLRQSAGGLAKDPEFAQVQADGMKIAQLEGRNIAVGIDLRLSRRR